ncbi:MAG: Rnase Y domain-containing protein, partial [Planctomycetota bacterium]
MTILLTVIDPLDTGVAALLGAIVGFLLGWVIFGMIPGNTIRRANREAEQIVQTGKAEGEAVKQRIALEAEKKAAERREAIDRELAGAQDEIKQAQSRLAKREDNLDKKLEKLGQREEKLDQQDAELKQLAGALELSQQELDQQLAEVRQRLESVSGMSEQQAKDAFLEEVRREYEHEANVLSQKILEDAEASS